jgi:hypothetical protein
MAEQLVEGPVGQALIDYITAQKEALGLANASVSARVQDAPHVRIVESGGDGDRDVVIFGQQITIETFGATLTQSSALMRGTMAGIRGLQHTVQGGITFYGLRTMGAGQNREDTVTKRCRYTRTFVIDSRLTPIS